MNIPYVMRKCTKCGEWKVASTVNFSRQKAGKYGLMSQCKKCEKKRRKQYNEANREKISKQKKQYREATRDKMCEYQKQYYKANKKKVDERHKRYYENNKEKVLEHVKQYREDNKEKILERSKQYYENNKDKVAERHKQYRKDNKDKIAEYHKQRYKDNRESILEQCKQYREANKEKVSERHKQYYEDNRKKILERHKQYHQSPQGQAVRFNSSQRRRIKEENQGDGITKDQWLEMMQYFDWKCAYSGETLTKDTRSIDHIVPISTGGDNMIWNCVPMTRSLNSSKQDKDMLEWYKEQECYDPSRLQKIYEWQEYAYNKYGKDTEYFNSGDIQIKLI